MVNVVKGASSWFLLVIYVVVFLSVLCGVFFYLCFLSRFSLHYYPIWSERKCVRRNQFQVSATATTAEVAVATATANDTHFNGTILKMRFYK